MSGPLARHLVSACTRLGDTVIHLDATDHQLVSAALVTGCRVTATFADPALAGVTWTRLTRTHLEDDLQVADLRVIRPENSAQALEDLSGTAALVVVQQSCAPSSDEAGRPAAGAAASDVQPIAVSAAATLLKPGGHLAVVTGLHRAEDRVVDPVPEVIRRARGAGLRYLQHIIALRLPVRGERIDPVMSQREVAAAQALPPCAGLPVSARVHSDVLLFTKVTGLADGSCELGEPRHKAKAGERTGSALAADSSPPAGSGQGGTTQAGGGR
ncbi:hypothetical protein FH608_023965 [Nonomuraea phyllanthi]|uniref:SAM-dependent methyltransferase n=1 Tax=Nonomuraea phyllanthi TaxID=2219224 RepID=A0A5C4WB67_9ACTN|nr:hypothetical protein [Nonomuraea phyllanthi]KAB8192563.1 hypothetical protein FH608_023965 [Nonomuraea phyllanthi]